MNDTTTPSSTPSSTTTSTAKGGHENNYPFRTKKAIKAQILEDDGFMIQCLQTMSERHARRAPGMKGCGWMSSHESRAESLAEKARKGDLTPEEVSLARETVKSYSKQLAAEFRQRDLADNPELAKATEAFFRPNGS